MLKLWSNDDLYLEILLAAFSFWKIGFSIDELFFDIFPFKPSNLCLFFHDYLLFESYSWYDSSFLWHALWHLSSDISSCCYSDDLGSMAFATVWIYFHFLILQCELYQFIGIWSDFSMKSSKVFLWLVIETEH